MPAPTPKQRRASKRRDSIGWVRNRRRYGDQRACCICGHDVEWHGRAVGWIDRGAGRECLPYTERGQIKYPPAGSTHRVTEI